MLSPIEPELLIELPVEDEGDDALLIEPLGDSTPPGDVGEFMEPPLMEPLIEPDGASTPGEVGELIPCLFFVVGVGAMTATGEGAVTGATIPGTDGPVTGAGADGAGTIPEQQSRKIPSVVGQHSPVKPKEAQTG